MHILFINKEAEAHETRKKSTNITSSCLNMRVTQHNQILLMGLFHRSITMFLENAF